MGAIFSLFYTVPYGLYRDISNFIHARRAIGSERPISCVQAQKLMKDGYTFLDVRSPYEFNGGHVPNSVNIPYRLNGLVHKNEKFTEEVAAMFDKESKIIVSCLLGLRSASALKDLKALGYNDVFDMGAGHVGWVRCGFPITK